MKYSDIQKIEKRKDYQNLVSYADQYLANAKSFVVKSDEDEKKAVGLKGEIKDTMRKGEEMKKFFVDPHKKFIKMIEEKFSVLKTMKEADDTLKEKMIKYQEKKDEKIKKEKEKIMEKMKKDKNADLGEATEALEKVGASEKTVEAEGHKVTYRVDRKVLVEDEAKLPRKYLMPNMSLIKKKAKEGENIPGVKVVEEKTPVTY